jgi:hypothetical protein
MPVFNPVLRESEDFPIIITNEDDEKEELKPLTVGGVRLNHDNSRSFLQPEEEKEESVLEENEAIKNGMLYMQSLAAFFRKDTEANIEKIKQGQQPKLKVKSTIRQKERIVHVFAESKEP